MSLNKKSLIELRGIAQSIGMSLRLDVGKDQLLQEISQHVSAKVQMPEKPIQVNISMPNNQGGTLTQHAIEQSLAGFMDLGLVVTFPDEFTWEIYCNGKRDTGTMAMPMWSIVQCVKEVIKP